MTAFVIVVLSGTVLHPGRRPECYGTVPVYCVAVWVLEGRLAWRVSIGMALVR